MLLNEIIRRIRPPLWLAVAIVLFAGWTVYFVADWVSFSPTPVNLRALISKAGATEFKYATPQPEGFSPACGCNRDEPDIWRGVSFMSRRMVVDEITESSLKGTVMLVFAPIPSTFQYEPSLFDMKVAEFTVDVRNYDRPKVEVSATGEPIVRNAVKMFESQHGYPGWYAFHGIGEVTFETTGDIPIAAWSPIRGSIVRLSSAANPSDLSEYEYSIDERYLPDTQPLKGNGLSASAPDFGYPALDLMGPVVWAWQLEEHIGDLDRYALVRIEAPFSIRVLIEATDPKHPAAYNYRSSRGHARLSFTKSTKDVDTFNRVSKAIARRPEWLVKPAERPVVDPATGKRNSKPPYQFMIVRAPPAPPSDGFNILGHIDSVSMENATGTVMIGSQQWGLSNASVSFSNLSSLLQENPSGSVPVQLSGDSVAVDAAFSATGEVTINGSPITTPLRKWDEYIQRANVVVLAAGLVTTLLSFVAWLWSALASPKRTRLKSFKEK